MRSTIIPAQITTVEDKIAGSLNFTQMILLMIPVLWSLLLYAFFPPVMHLNSVKDILISLVFIVSVILAFRIRGHIILEWILIYGRYSLRPSYYVFDKNDPLYREIVPPVKTKTTETKVSATDSTAKVHSSIPIKALISLDTLLTDARGKVQFKALKDGRLNVAYQQVDR